jgi:hypothetical protein
VHADLDLEALVGKRSELISLRAFPGREPKEGQDLASSGVLMEFSTFVLVALLYFVYST